jgi:ABC-type antimicrobial peptide transport system permease subunit
MEIPVLAGRDFGPEDRRESPKTAVVNEAFAKKYFGAVNPVGQRFEVVPGSQPGIPYQVVGLVGNTKYLTLRDRFDPVVFLPLGQADDVSYVNLLARGVSVGDVEATIRRLALEVDPSISVRTTELEARARNGVVHEQMVATLAGYFGALALTLATIGLYGVLAYLVARRTNEVGLRMALGADRGAIIRMIVGEGLALTAGGLVLGAGLTIVAIKLTTVTLFGIKATDPLTLAGGIATLVAAALLAGYLPGRRASRVDPMEALRAD